jgi:glucose-6-phosphate isomerase
MSYWNNNHLYHDPESQFTLNLYGWNSLNNLEDVLDQYKYSIRIALETISQIERGEVVNCTANEKESENRAVDHYNLRMEEELVKGKSLARSLQQWEDIRSKVGRILNGEVVNEFGDRYTDVIFNGIGGSYLGPLMILIAMKGDRYNFDSQNPDSVRMRLHFVSNTDPDSFHLLLSKLKLECTLMVNMSKSGGTAETRGNMEAFNAQIQKHEKKLHVGRHNIAVTVEGSNFDKYARENQFLHVFYMFNETGGRTSIVSAIGMVPSAFAELKFDEFLKGQSHMDKLTRQKDPRQNPAMLIAIAIDHLCKLTGRKNMIVLGYSDFLKEFAHYLQQLYMESLGKEYSKNGAFNPEGLTVFGGVGTGEQHAFMQQVQKGINDCFVRFIHFTKRNRDYADSEAGSMGRQLLAFVKGTENALLNNRRSFITTAFDRCNMFNLGMMVALEERIVTILGAFRNINAYDQPGVQDGKKAAQHMNTISLSLEKKINERLKSGGKWEGDALQAIKDFDLPANTPIWYVDAILSDMYGNANEETGSYPMLKNHKINRRFEKDRFLYSML